MDAQSILNRITEIGTCEDEATRRTLLANLTEDINSVSQEVETLTTERDNLMAANENLRESNMQLFLKVGNNNPQNTDPTPGAETPELKYENLFNEKGELK